MSRRVPAIWVAISLSASAGPALAATPGPDWAAAAAEDLTAMHDILRDNSPAMVVDRDSLRFRSWLDDGYRSNLARARDVTSAAGYAFLLRNYALGFRDAHIQFRPTAASGVDLATPRAWPGFVLGARARGYVVAYRASDAVDAPPQGAVLISCDGRPADALAASRDLYDVDLSIASNKVRAAYYLLLDRNDPYAPPPSRCVFRAGRHTRAYALHWRSTEAGQMKTALAASVNAMPRTLGLEAWGGSNWWLTIPSMGDDQDWPAFYAAVSRDLNRMRSADRIVIDLRGNGGGSSLYADKLAELLWGRDVVDPRRPVLGPTVWRASRLNRDYWARMTDRLSKEPAMSADDKAGLRAVLADYDKALAEGRDVFREGDAPPLKYGRAPKNLTQARVILLTDYACNSACLDLMDLFTAMPNVVQAGTPTGADTIFMELTQVDRLPSGYGAFGFGHKAWIDRPRGSNQAYIPSDALTWRGEPSDEAGLRAWLRSATATPTP